MESGFGIISSLQGIGSGNLRRLSPWKVRPYALQMLYCRKSVKSVFTGGESEDAYQAHCEHFELILGFEAPLFENTYKINQLCGGATGSSDSLSKTRTLDHAVLMIYKIVLVASDSS